MISTNKRTLWTSSLAAAGIVCMLGAAGCGTGTGGAAESPGSGDGADQSSSGESAEKAAGTDSKEPGGSGGSGDSGDSAASGDPASTEGADSSGADSGADSSESTCASDDLEASLGSGEGGGAAGTRYMRLMLTNSSDSACVIKGFPGVSYVAGDNGEQVGPSAAREGAEGSAVTLNPGETGYASVGFANVENFDADVCQPTEIRGLRIYPPGETAALFVPSSGTGCAGSDIPGDQLTVGAVQ